MAKRKGSKNKFSNHGWGIDVDVPKELIEKLNDYTNGKIDGMIIKALHASAQPFKQELLDYMSPANHPKYGTGEANRSMREVYRYNGQEIDPATADSKNWSGGKINVDVGFDINTKGGRHALMVDLGYARKKKNETLKGTYFVYYARRKVIDRVKEAQIKTLQAFFDEQDGV